jgi:hypothetical protein
MQNIFHVVFCVQVVIVITTDVETVEVAAAVEDTSEHAFKNRIHTYHVFFD